jgi:transglutaminase-like putative cysteine protease
MIEVTVPPGTGLLLAPRGLSSPAGTLTAFEVAGAATRQIWESATGQTAIVAEQAGAETVFRYAFGRQPLSYPNQMFRPTNSRYVRAADELVEETRDLAGGATGLEAARRIACEVAERFTYGHPETRFNDGLDHVPALGCGLTEGSCVDINTYFIAALRANGIEAGYVTGYFFPAEKGDWCEDMHCWVVTRIGRETQEWDIAHHLKLGTRDIRPARNPKPGFRQAMAHSMGLSFPDLGIQDLKLIAEPVRVDGGETAHIPGLSIRLARKEATVS